MVGGGGGGGGIAIIASSSRGPGGDLESLPLVELDSRPKES